MTAVSVLDNEVSSYLRAQHLLAVGTGVLEVSCAVPLRRYVDPAQLRSNLEEIADLKLEKFESEYLQQTNLFSDAFLTSLGEPIPSMGPVDVEVKTKDQFIKVIVKGGYDKLALWETPIRYSIHELYFGGLVKEHNLNYTALFAEGIRRFQVKLDMLRNSNVRFVEAGTSSRPDVDWYATLVPLIMGDAFDLMIGTTNLNAAMFHGLSPISVDPDFPGGLTGSTEFVTIESATVKKVEEGMGLLDGRIPVVRGANAYEMAHLHSHFGDDLLFEWGADLTFDMGPIGGALPLTTVTRDD